MHQDQASAWYAQRQLDAPITDAIPALDVFAWHASLRPASPYARLLARPSTQSGPAPPNTPSRSFTGHVPLRASVGVPVELNLTAWSRDRSAIGVRPTGHRPPVVRQTRYFAGTHALLDDIAMKLNLLVHLEDGPRSDSARHYARALIVSATPPTVPRLTYSPR